MCYVTIASYIILGNCATFNLGNRLPIKIAEIISLFSILILYINYKDIIIKNNFIKKISIFIIICFLSLLVNEIIYKYDFLKILYSFLYPLRIVHLLILATLICTCFKKNNIKFNIIIKFIIKCYCVVCIIGIIQLLFFPVANDFYNLFYKIGIYFPNPDPHINRLISTYFDPNFLGCCLLIPFTFSFINWLKNGKGIDLLYFLLFFITIILTVSRSALLGAIIIGIVIFFSFILDNKNNKFLKIRFNEKLTLLFIIGLLGIIVSYFAGVNVRVFDRVFNTMSDGSTFARFDSWEKGIKIFKDNPIFGIGYNTLGYYSENIFSKPHNLASMFGIDSSLLLILTTTGIIGSLYFIYIIIFSFKKLMINKNKYIVTSLISILISSLICCNFNNLLFYILWLFPMLLLTIQYDIEYDNKNILIDARMINMSGIGTYIQNLIKNGCYDKALGKNEELNGYFTSDNIIEYDSKIYGIKEQLKFPYRKVAKLNPSVLHIPHYNVPIFYNGRMVVTIHDLTHLILPEFLPNRFAYYYAKIMIWIAVHKAEHIFTVSENTKKDLIKFYKLKEDKITVTYNGIGNEFVKKDITQIEYLYKRFNIPKNKKIIMYVGNLKPHKNLERLLRAYSQIEDKSNMILLLVGKAFEKYNIFDNLEKELKIENNVIHTGIVTQDELVDLYNIADLFVFPSLYEGFGLPPLESLKCGTPAICANNSSIPEVCGELVDYFNAYNIDEIKDKIIKNINKKEKLDNKKIQEWLKKFDWNNNANIVKKELK